MKYPLCNTVAEAAEIMDKESPGWAEKIDLEKFNITDAKNCVVGQIFNHFTSKMTEWFDYPTNCLRREREFVDEYGNKTNIGM